MSPFPSPSRAPDPPSEAFFRATVPPYRLGELLVSIAEQELSGRLILQSDTGERTLHFLEGYPVFAASSQFAERLGALGVRYALFSRDAVAAALALARGHGTELGRALLELEHIDGANLFRLLSAQLVEQLASSCGSAHSRARFVLDPRVTDGIVVLRVHPLTAVLTAVRRMALTEQHKMLEAVQGRRVVSSGFGLPTLTWLGAIGFVGAPESLLEDEPTVGTIRARLVERVGELVQQMLDPKHAPLYNPTDAAHAPRLTTRAVADMVTLTLLLGGSLKLAGSAVLAEADDALPNTAAGVQAMLNRASQYPLPPVPAAPDAGSRNELERALHTYLTAPRDPVTDAASAVWGPGAEVTASSSLSELLTLYLTLKPERDPRATLALESQANRDEVVAAHAQYASFLTALARADAGPLVHCKVQELRTHIDDAVRALVPDALEDDAEELTGDDDEVYFDQSAGDPGELGGALPQIPRAPRVPQVDLDAPTLPPPPPAGEPAPARRNDETPVERGRRSNPTDRQSTPSDPPPASDGTTPEAESSSSKSGREDSWVKRPETMYKRIDTMLRAGDYEGVCRLLDRRAEVASLPYELELARNLAHRQLALAKSIGNAGVALPLLVATGLLGMALGWALRHLDLLVF